MRKLWGGVAIVVVAMVGAVLWGGPVTVLWKRTLAAPCPAGVVASDCVLTLPAQVVGRFDDHDEDTQLDLDIRGAPADTVIDWGYAHAFLSSPQVADRLGITRLAPFPTVRVTLFDRQVITVTGPTGQSAESNSPVGKALLILLVTSGAVILLVAAGARVRRRVQGEPVSGVGHALGAATVATIAGQIAGIGADRVWGPAGVMPSTFVVMVLVSLAVAIVLRRFGATAANWLSRTPALR